MRSDASGSSPLKYSLHQEDKNLPEIQNQQECQILGFVFFFTPDLLTSCFFPLDATVYVGGLDEKVSEPLLWELFLQAGPVVNTHMPKDRVTGQHQGEYLGRTNLV